ncbi:MAG: type IX secretion system membrane protein PorP/SprF [Flavobacteriaceae bacterium]|nr:type IX secretion system membrane protein PorP/SprF [Flavobacteriaceae bacterium]
MFLTLQANYFLKFGYSYEFNTSALTPYSSESHEIFISYEFDFPNPGCNCENTF